MMLSQLKKLGYFLRNPLSTLHDAWCRFDKGFQADETFTNVDGHKYRTWRGTRRCNMNHLVSDLLQIVLYITLSTALGPWQRDMLPDRQRGGPYCCSTDKYGIAYRLGIWGWWIFSLVLLPLLLLCFLFSEWLPALWDGFKTHSGAGEQLPTSTTTDAETDADHVFFYYARKFNQYAFLFTALGHLIVFYYHLYETFLDIGAKPTMSSVVSTLPIDNRKNRSVRFGLAIGVFASLALGVPVMISWRLLGMVHVTTLEYVVVIVPVQIIIGIVAASIFQAAYEKERQLPRDLFEKDVDGELTVEGMRQAMSFLVNSEIDMKTLQEIGAGKHNGKDAKVSDEKDDTETKAQETATTSISETDTQ